MAGLQGQLITLVTWGNSGGPFPRVVRWLAKGLASKGFRVDIIFIQDAKSTREVSANIREIGLGTRARYALFPLYRYFKSNKPDLVLATPLPSALAASLAGRWAGVPVVVQEVTFLSLAKPFLPPAMRLTGRAVQKIVWNKLSSAVTATSLEVAEKVQGQVRQRQVFILPNPCDVDEIRSLAQDGARKERDNILITVGRLSHEKGIDVLLRSLNMILDKNLPDWRLWVLGDGPRRQEYENMAEKLGLGDRVKFWGYVANPYPLMARADIFVHPARWEGFGLVVVEAMALGLPVIATTCPGGPKEILGFGEYGLLVPPEDPESLAQAIASLISNPERRRELSNLSLKRVEDYRPEKIAERLLEIGEFIRNEQGNR